MDNIRILEFDGLKVKVYEDKANSWGAFKLLKKIRETSEDDFAQLDALIELIEFATDATEAKVVKHLGGDSANMLEVAKLMAQIVAGVYPKN